MSTTPKSCASSSSSTTTTSATSSSPSPSMQTSAAAGSHDHESQHAQTQIQFIRKSLDQHSLQLPDDVIRALAAQEFTNDGAIRQLSWDIVNGDSWDRDFPGMKRGTKATLVSWGQAVSEASQAGTKARKTSSIKNKEDDNDTLYISGTIFWKEARSHFENFRNYRDYRARYDSEEGDGEGGSELLREDRWNKLHMVR